MVGLNQNFRKVYVSNNDTMLVSGTTTALASGQLGIFNADTYLASAAPSWSTSKAILIVEGTPDQSGLPKGAGIRNETDKSKTIVGKKITNWTKKAYSAGQQQIIAIGYDGVDNTKTISGKCDEVKHLYIKLTGKPVETLIPTGFILHVEAQGPCCATCGDSCESVDPEIFADEFITRINQYTFLGGIPLSKFILVEKLTGTNGDGDPIAGIKFTGAFVEHDSDNCYFDLFPYNSDPVHIQLSEYNPDWHGSRCESTYPVTELQDVAYPMGAGQMVQRYEAMAKGWDMRYYYKYDIAARKAEGQYLNTDVSLNYDQYSISFSVSYHVLGWSRIEEDNYTVEVFVPTGYTGFKNAINTYISSVTGLGIATV